MRLYDVEVGSRLLLGTAQYPSPAILAESVRASGAKPFVLLFADMEVLQTARRGQPKNYDPLIRYFKERQIDYLDSADAFQDVSPTGPLDEWFAPKGHYSEAGNRKVASWLTREILKRFELPVSAASGR